VSQQLVPRGDGTGRVAAIEVMIATPAIRNLIREAKAHQITSLMQAGGRYNMQTMDSALAELVIRGLVSESTAEESAVDPEAFLELVKRGR
jgi:twitching motility protein PilT